MKTWIARWKNRLGQAGWLEWEVLAAMLVVCAGAWLFIALAAWVRDEGTHELELSFMRSLRTPEDPHVPIGPFWIAEVMRDFTALGGAVVVIMLSLLVIIYLALRRRWTRVVLLVVTVAGGYALSNGLKNVIDRPRPDIVPHLTHVSSASFPSGHSMMASIVYITLGALLAQAAERRREKVFFLAVAFLLSGIIGFSRVYLGVHFPTDVLAGWCAGTVWAFGCWLVARWSRARREAARAAP